MTSLVSVVVPAYNGARFLGEALDSVLAQRWPALELIVVDDGSTDDTPALLEGYAGRLRVLRQPNQGVAAARNTGAAAARGAYLAFLDQDDVWEPELLATLVPELERRPECSLAYADSWIIDARGRAHGRRGRFLRRRAGGFEALLAYNFVPIETAVLSAASWRALGGFDAGLRYLEDWELCLRALRQGPFAFVDRPLARYRVHDKNLSHALEPLVLEGFALMERVEARCAPLSAREAACVASERTRLALDLSWLALRRGDRRTAREWRARAGPGQARRKLRVGALGLALRVLPASLGELVLAALPRRRLYGLGARELAQGEQLDP